MLQWVAAAQQPRLVVPVGHTQEITTTCFSYDGEFVATAARDFNIKIWHAGTGRLLKTLYGHKNHISDIAFSPKGNYLFSAAFGDSLNHIWNLQSGQEMIRTERMTYPDIQLKFSTDDQWAIALQPHTIALWNLSTGKLTDSFQLKKQDGSFHYFSYAAISPDNKWIAGYDYSNHTVAVWNRASHTLLKKFSFDMEYGTRDIAFSASSRQLYFFTSVVFMAADISTGKNIYTSGPYSWSMAMPRLTDQGRYLFTGGYEQQYKVVNGDTMNVTYDERYVFQPSLLNLQTFRTTQLKGEKPGSPVLNLTMDNAGKLMLVTTYSQLLLYRVVNDRLVKIASISSDSLGYGNSYNNSSLSPDGKYILSGDKKDVPVLLDNRCRLLVSLQGNIAYDKEQYFSDDGDHIFTSTGNKQQFSWDVKAGKISGLYDTTLPAKKTAYEDHLESLNGLLYDTTAGYWEITKNGKTVVLRAENKKRPWCKLSPKGNYAFTYEGDDSLARIWDAKTGSLLYQLSSTYGDFSQPVVSNDERYLALLVSNASEQLDLMWDNLQKELDGDTTGYRSKADVPNEIRVLELATGKQLLYLQDTSGYLYYSSLSFSEGGKYFSIAGEQFTIRETDNWQQVLFAAYGCEQKIPAWAISPDGKLAVVSCNNNSTLYRTGSNQLVYILPGAVSFASFSDDGERILTESEDKQLKVWGTRSGQLLYTFYAFDKGDYIVTDAYDRYDGTEEARKKLYYSCGNEFIDLAQFKDQLWVPNLAERIMQGDTINAPRLSDLNICGLTPEVKSRDGDPSAYYFIITPRRGGLGETVLYINGMEAKRYLPAALKKVNNRYELRVTKEELRTFFITGKENTVTLKAFTADNTISSRGVILTDTARVRSNLPPNLYALMVGVSDYKGDDLDLRYAAKDATDLSMVISAAAKRMLNGDSVNHVFVYNLTTSRERYLLPEKNSIKRTLEEIGKKATANDILLVFFAGHGIMAGEPGKKQFYFLTADASSLTSSGTISNAGVSTTELSEWMKPQNIKAQKRILILDACNSGQAINDFVQLGKGKQGYTAARNDDRSQLIKAIDKLNEKSGLFILSASASNQEAYESGRYKQGLLTHALLKAVKLQPDILEDGKYLNVSRWFNAAEKTVSEMSRESGARQEPQLVSNTNFDIGVVDEKLQAAIVLSEEEEQKKPLFTTSILQNNDAAADGDNLAISTQINLLLKEMGTRPAGHIIDYKPDVSSPAAITISGRYDVKGDEVIIRVSIRSHNETKYRFEEKGTKTALKDLIQVVVARAVEWAVTNNK